VRELAAAEASPYQVALVLSGAGSLDAEPAAALGVGVIERESPRWAVSALDPPAAAARALRDFVDGRATPGEATPLLVRVEAWDPEQARLRALLAAESVREHLVAEHPGADFSLGAEALVLNVAAGTARRAGGAPRTVRRGRAPRSENPPGLLPFLRANALARGAVSPALRVLHAWIALECLTRDGGRDGAEPGERPALNLKLESYLPPHLASLAAIAGLRALLLTSWDEVRGLALCSPRREDWLRMEDGLGVAAGRPRSLCRLVTLLRGLDGDGPLAELLADIGPFPARRLADLGRRFDRGSRLAKVAEGIQVRTLIAIARLKLARHVTVHRGFDAAGVTPALALGAVRLLDSTFEVLRRWLGPDAEPADAVAEARRWHERNLIAWRSAEELDLDADHLLHPERE
jgi:hypothetical protein